MAENRPIFITARVRSGSTMLWHLYDQLPGYRAFNQPCHDNLLPHIRHTRPTASHRGVQDYWRAYRPLLDDLPRWHRPAFGLTRMLLEADDDWPELRDYLQWLLDQCPGETPVLQFNTGCWRLPWLKQHFPQARFIHLWRDPRDHWLSMVRHLPVERWDEPDLDDAYELLQWSADLAPQLPFLFTADVDCSYARAYYLWRLSRLAGDRLADRVLSYNNELQAAPEQTLHALAEAGLLREADVAPALACIEQTPAGGWAKHHPAAWFERIETRCDQQLDELGLTAGFGLEPVRQIRDEHAAAWARLDSAAATARALNRLLLAYSGRRGETTRLLDEVRLLRERCEGGTAEPAWWGRVKARMRAMARRIVRQP